ncbi:unnamed protein product [Spodoptera exigua]|uniref:Uncharacterized protein n=1 Tax=Spodoptera exigua TaxID=7107 RepID=A0A835GA47_SPOEX|nr:hypothetical protein HW555_008990 [Spodoptera exigua]KAH9634652.1 hypothetical protein HF086_000624 [Spodoptera exigua]CAH0703175.1 unnamed protein product [Spodoptera exigua]
MTDSSSFTSLFALVDSHLSKCNLNDTPSEDGRVGSLPMPMLNLPRGLSDTGLSNPPPRLPIPTFTLSESPIANVLSEQLSNMFKAKELKKQQELEQEKLQEEMRRMALEEKNCVIDLMKAVQKPQLPDLKPKEEPSSINSSFESLVLDYKEFVANSPRRTSEVGLPTPEPEPLLPIKTDMSYILKQKIKRGKCSAFGKVLTSRLRPVAAPYLREKVPTNIVRFDFSTKSPCDLIKEKLKRKPVHTTSNSYDFF